MRSLRRDWRRVLCQHLAVALRRPPPGDRVGAMHDGPGQEPSARHVWVEQEFGRVDFPDARLRSRLLRLATPFAVRGPPTAPIPVVLNGEEHDVKAA